MSLNKPSHYNKEVDGVKIAIQDVTPAITARSIKADVDGQQLELLYYRWTYEKLNKCTLFPEGVDTSNGCFMPMIVAQFAKPKLEPGLHTLKVRLTDARSGNMGEAITHFVTNKKGLGF